MAARDDTLIRAVFLHRFSLISLLALITNFLGVSAGIQGSGLGNITFY